MWGVKVCYNIIKKNAIWWENLHIVGVAHYCVYGYEGSKPPSPQVPSPYLYLYIWEDWEMPFIFKPLLLWCYWLVVPNCFAQCANMLVFYNYGIWRLSKSPHESSVALHAGFNPSLDRGFTAARNWSLSWELQATISGDVAGYLYLRYLVNRRPKVGISLKWNLQSFITMQYCTIAYFAQRFATMPYCKRTNVLCYRRRTGPNFILKFFPIFVHRISVILF